MAIKCIAYYLVRCENGGEFASKVEESVRGSAPKKVSALSFLLFLTISLMDSSDSDPALAEERALGLDVQGARKAWKLDLI